MKWIGLAMLAALPLQWYVVGSSVLGMGRLHQVAFLLFTVVVLVRIRPKTHIPVLRAALPFVVLNLYMFAIWALVDLYHGEPPTGAVQQLIYLGVFVALGTYVYRAAVGRAAGIVEVLRWSAAVAAVALVGGLTLSMLGNGVNPLGVVQQAVATGDPEVLQRELFRSSFTGYGFDEETVRGNLRHEIFGAILLAMYVSSWAVRMRPLVSSALRIAFRVSMVVCVVLLLVSMSRSVLIAAAAWPLVSLMQAVRTMSLTRRQMVTAYACGAAVLLLLVSGLGKVLWTRFTEDTASYEARGGRYENAFASIRENFFLGGVPVEGVSSHNFVLDSWLRGGVLMGVVAAVILLLLVAAWVRVLVRLPLEPSWMVPVAAAFALPIDRMLTVGSGLIPPVEWLTLGFIAGVAAARRHQRVPAASPEAASVQT